MAWRCKCQSAAIFTLSALRAFTRAGVVDRARELKQARDTVATLRVKCASIEQPIGELSGGNQQKVAATKWMLTDPVVVVFEEPTRGVDVEARIEIYHLITELAQQDKARQSLSFRRTYPKLSAYPIECSRWWMGGSQASGRKARRKSKA